MNSQNSNTPYIKKEYSENLLHSVKNNLQNISGMLQLLNKQCELNHIKIDSMQPVCQVIENLINSLNNSLRNHLESSIPINCSLNQLIIDVMKSQGPLLACYQIQLQSQLAENLPPLLLYKQHIRQLLINCLDNSREAIRAKKQAGGQIVISTLFDKKEKVIQLLIEDNGIGLSAEQQANFFVPYYTTKLYGSGLGTCFCQDIVKMHGGAISASGQPGLGCCVTINLPLQNSI